MFVGGISTVVIIISAIISARHVVRMSRKHARNTSPAPQPEPAKQHIEHPAPVSIATAATPSLPEESDSTNSIAHVQYIPFVIVENGEAALIEMFTTQNKEQIFALRLIFNDNAQWIIYHGVHELATVDQTKMIPFPELITTLNVEIKQTTKVPLFNDTHEHPFMALRITSTEGHLHIDYQPLELTSDNTETLLYPEKVSYRHRTVIKIDKPILQQIPAQSVPENTKTTNPRKIEETTDTA